MSPVVDDDPGFEQRVELFDGEALVAQPSVERFDPGVLPRGNPSVIYPGGTDEFLAQTRVGQFLLQMVTQDPSLVVNEAVVTPLGEAGYP